MDQLTERDPREIPAKPLAQTQGVPSFLPYVQYDTQAQNAMDKLTEQDLYDLLVKPLGGSTRRPQPGGGGG